MSEDWLTGVELHHRWWTIPVLNPFSKRIIRRGKDLQPGRAWIGHITILKLLKEAQDTEENAPGYQGQAYYNSLTRKCRLS